MRKLMVGVVCGLLALGAPGCAGFSRGYSEMRVGWFSERHSIVQEFAELVAAVLLLPAYVCVIYPWALVTGGPDRVGEMAGWYMTLWDPTGNLDTDRLPFGEKKPVTPPAPAAAPTP